MIISSFLFFKTVYLFVRLNSNLLQAVFCRVSTGLRNCVLRWLSAVLHILQNKKPNIIHQNLRFCRFELIDVPHLILVKVKATFRFGENKGNVLCPPIGAYFIFYFKAVRKLLQSVIKVTRWSTNIHSKDIGIWGTNYSKIHQSLSIGFL